MGYVFDHKEAQAYDEWLNQRENQVTLELENRVMLEMIQPLCGKRLIDIGCGTGHSLLPFMDKGAYLTGVDASPSMLDIAHAKLGHRVDLHRAYAEDLPFDDNYFHYAVLCLTLEFVDDPRKALAEACRVAKDGVFVGVLNKYALKSINRRIKSIFRPTVYSQARFLSIGDVKHLFRMLIGDVPMFWRTVCLLPGRTHSFVYRLESSKMVQKIPFGAFAGIMALPVPKFRTTPLALKVVSNRANPAKQVVSCPGHSTGTQMLPNQTERAASSE